MAVKRISETTFQESAPRVDAQRGILYDVKLLGEHSRNHRVYTPKSMQESAPRYEGLKSYVDHPERERLTEDRKFRDFSGVFRNVHYVEGKGLFADWHLRKSGEHFEGIIEAAEKFPNSVGLSHVADGESRMDGDTEIIESIKEVFSVDLVTDPATTAGIFESRRKKKTLRQTIESLPEGTERKRLIEALNAGYIDGSLSMDEEAPKDEEPADPLTQMSSLVRELITMLGETLKALAMKTDKPATPPPAPDAPADDINKDKADELSPEEKQKAAFESVQRENAELKAKNLLLESGREAAPARIKALAKVSDEAERKELLESWPQLEESDRPLRSPPLVESSQADASVENIRSTFAAFAR